MPRHEFRVEVVAQDRCDVCLGWIESFDGIWKRGLVLLCSQHDEELSATPAEVTRLIKSSPPA